jgi:hypothetical protein
LSVILHNHFNPINVSKRGYHDTKPNPYFTFGPRDQICQEEVVKKIETLIKTVSLFMRLKCEGTKKYNNVIVE